MTGAQKRGNIESRRPVLPAVYAMLKQDLMLAAKVLIAVFAFGSCAAGPEFKPSLPLERASSVQEGLVGCAEYHAPSSIHRPIVLRPYLDCVEETFEAFPNGVTAEYRVFLEELSLNYRTIQEVDWSPSQGIKMEGAIRALLESLWRGELGVDPLTWDEKVEVMRYFPRTSRLVKVRKWSEPPFGRQTPWNAGLERLNARVASLETLGGILGASCYGVEGLKKERDYLNRLWKDLAELGLPKQHNNDKFSNRLEQAHALASRLEDPKGIENCHARYK